MRTSASFLLFLTLLAGCGTESDESAREAGVVAGSSETVARDGRSSLPALNGRAEAAAEARAQRKATTMASLAVDERVRGVMSDAELAIVEDADLVRLIVGDPVNALSEAELAEGFVPTDFEVSPSATVSRAGDRGELAFRVLRSIAGSDGTGARCFQPEHTIRFCRAGQCIEVSVCLGCRRLAVVVDGEDGRAEVRHATIDGSLRSTLIGMCRRYRLSDQPGGC